MATKTVNKSTYFLMHIHSEEGELRTKFKTCVKQNFIKSRRVNCNTLK